jgi:hypothetical protein
LTRFRLLAILVCLGVFTGVAGAGEFPVRISAARVGLPPAGKSLDRDDSGQAVHIAKFACWAPVYLDLELSTPVAEPAELVIEAPDPDEISTTITFPLDLARAPTGSRVAAVDLGTIGYVRPAGAGELMLHVRSRDGKALSEPYRVRTLRPRDPLSYVVLALGGPMPGFELPKPQGSAADPAAELRGGRIEPTVITDIAQLPDHWLGYDAADLVVLNTGSGADDFIRKLFAEQPAPADLARRQALLEWVRRGGRLVVTVGGNAPLVSRLPALQDILPYAVSSSAPNRPSTSTLVLYWGARESSQTTTMSGALALRGAAFPIANLAPRPGHPARVLIPTRERQADIKDVTAAQAALGMGRVTVLAFDLDRPPFTEFSQRAEFWDWVLREGGANRASAGSDGKPLSASTGTTEAEDDLAIALRMHMDTFAGVPVISFGWIALLIGLYILLIGPVEYFFLKRVLGRLELTWITFPVIVATVSLAAYFTAYSFKGRELKINKFDVVDIDPRSGRAHGTTWFTIFSPRIETYTLGVTPAEGWTSGGDPSGTTVSWVGAPRGGRASLLRRSYQYHSDARGVADGLDRVPVQVWSTKSFVANWSGEFDPSSPTAAIESRLEHPPGDPDTVIGTIIDRLPVPLLSDCVLFYRGLAYPLPGGTIGSGETVRVVLDKGTPAVQWLQKESRLEALYRRVPTYTARPGAGRAPINPAASDTPLASNLFPFWGVLFHETALSHAEGEYPRNPSLRRLDESWRLASDNVGEVILVGRVGVPGGPAEQTLSGASSPSRLWLKGVPGGGAARTPIPGTGRQETWVRVFLPVK